MGLSVHDNRHSRALRGPRMHVDGGTTEVRSKHGAGAAAAALLLGILAAAPAQAAELVSNLRKTAVPGIVTHTQVWAQPFTTGPLRSRLTHVRVRNTNDAVYSVSIYTVDSAGDLLTEVAAFTSPASYSDDVDRFTAPLDTILKADTTYAVRLSQANGLRYTTSNDEDAGAAAGWSIADAYLRLTGGGWAETVTGNALMIAIDGELIPNLGISGTAQVDETLVAVTADIRDADGVTNPTYTYQWIRVDGPTDTDISAATSATYDLVAADVGKRVKVKVSFRDDGNNLETRTSAAFPATGTVRAAPAGALTPPALATTAPSVPATSNRLSVPFDEDLDAGNLPRARAFAVLADGIPVAVTGVGTETGKASVLTLTLASPIAPATRTVTVSYTDPTSGDDTAALQDAAGNDAATFENIPVGLVNRLALAVSPQFLPEGTSATWTLTATTRDDAAPASGLALAVGVATKDIEARGRSNEDYARLDTTVTFAGGDFSRQRIDGNFHYVATKTGTIGITRDGSVEGEERFAVAAGIASRDAGWALDPARATVAIQSEQVRLEDRREQAGTSVVGRLEVSYSACVGSTSGTCVDRDVWGTVCDDRMAEANNLAPAVACRLLGYADGELTEKRATLDKPTQGFGWYPGRPVRAGAVPIWLDDLRCHAGGRHWTDRTQSAPPSRLDLCSHAGIGLHNCGRREDVWLSCSGERGAADLLADAPPLTIRDSHATEGDDTHMTFNVALGTVLTGTDTVSVDYATEAVPDGTRFLGEARDAATAGTNAATPDADYRTTSGRLMFSNTSPRASQFAGEAASLMVETFRVPVVDDSVEDSGEIFRVRLSGIVGDAQFADATAIGIIFNDESETGLAATFTDVPASHDGSAFTVGLDFGEAVAATAATVTAVLSAEGASATAAARDAGQTRRWRVTATPESATATVVLTLGATTSCDDAGAVCTSDGRGVGTAVSATVAGAAPPGPVAASFAGVPAGHDGTAFAAALDLSEEVGGVKHAWVAGTLAEAAGGTVLRAARREPPANLGWTVEVEPDAAGTDVVLSVAVGATLPDGRAVAPGAPATVPGQSLSVADARATEGGTVSFAVTLDRAATGTATVDYATADGTATAGDDYAAASGTLTFAPGSSSRTVSVATTDDDAAEDDETFALTLSNASGAGIADDAATGTIADDGDEPRPALSVSDARAAEGGTATFAVTLDRAAEGPVRAFYTTVGGTATAGADFASAWATAEFPAGTTSRTVAVSLLDDDEKEFDETFVLELAWATGAGYADPTGVGTIVDDDAPRAELHTVPAEHGGRNQAFAAGLAFSEEIDGVGYRWVRDTLATATNAEVRRARRVVRDPPENREWTLRVRPSSAADVVLALTPGLRLPDGTPLGVGAAATVRGPTPDGAVVQGTRLTLAWPGARDGFGTASGSDWSVAVNGVPRAVASAEIAGRRAVLVLSAPVAAADAVAVGYVGSAMHPLADAAGTIRSAPWDGIAADNVTGTDLPRTADASARPAAERLGTAPPDALRLDASGLGLADLAALGAFASLERVDLSDNALAGLAGIGAHAVLRELDLSGNRVADLGPLRGLHALERLDVSGNLVADVSALAGLPALKVLVLDGNAVADLGPLTHLASLEHLSLADNAVEDVTALQDLPRLRRLDLGGNPVSALSPLGDVGSLQWLALPGEPAAAADVLARLTGLRWMWPAEPVPAAR